MDATHLEPTTLGRMKTIYALMEQKAGLEQKMRETCGSSVTVSAHESELRKCVADISAILWDPRNWLNAGQLLVDYRIYIAAVCWL